MFQKNVILKTANKENKQLNLLKNKLLIRFTNCSFTYRSGLVTEMKCVYHRTLVSLSSWVLVSIYIFKHLFNIALKQWLFWKLTWI